jgi:hypothetical protein
MAELKTGARLKSTVCNGEVMVVAAPAGVIELTCGGSPMVDPAADAARVDINPDQAVPIAIGKRYVTEDGTLEVLCVKAGEGQLAANGDLLLQKDTKKLPKTD